MAGEPAVVALRAATPADREFLFRVYASTRAEELAIVPWSAEQKEAFLRQQFHAQDTFYRERFPGVEYWVVERSGDPIGRLYLHHGPAEIRLMDIALLPEARGAGVGGGLLADLIARAAREGKRLTIHVEKTNRARHLYERLGFRQVADQGVYDFLEWRPAGAPAS